MRIYMNFKEGYEEIKRDLAEMGIIVKPKSMQDKVIEGIEKYTTKELQNYSYTIINAKSKEVTGVNQPWADKEFIERIDNTQLINPGEAWKERKEVWTEYLHDGKFAYTYNERINKLDQLEKIIKRIKQDPGSRQLWLSIWNSVIDINNLGGLSRVPCSLGYNFQVRDGKLNMHYVMRSCDFSTHFRNDVYLAIKLLEYVAERTNNKVGDFTHTMFSLHVYKKDVEDVF